VSAPVRTERATGVLALIFLLAGCGPRMDLGSDVWWVSLFETGTFEEWTGAPGGLATPPNAIKVSSDYAHHGHYAAELSIKTRRAETPGRRLRPPTDRGAARDGTSGRGGYLANRVPPAQPRHRG